MERDFNSIPKTIFCDIDGTILEHRGDILAQIYDNPVLNVLPGVLDRFKEWDSYGYKIILVTGRKECLRKLTEAQLARVGIVYDMLIMGIGPGIRYMINDKKAEIGFDTAIGITVERNIGLKDIKL